MNNLLFLIHRGDLCSMSSTLQSLNGLAQLIMGPLDIDREEHKTFLNVVRKKNN